MSSREERFAGTTEVREQHRFDVARLEAWMEAHVEGFSGPISIEQFRGGQSNPTYKLSTKTHQYVVRRKPPGDLLKGAHAVDREFRVVSALHKAGFPVARPYALCTDDDVIGTWFYVMDFVGGRVEWESTFPKLSNEGRAAHFDAMNATIAKLHSFVPDEIGLGDYGRPGNYFARQISRWSKQYLADDLAGRVPDMDKLVEWLPEHIPPSEETRIVHGDFRCDNMIFHATEPKVLAVLDWELSTLGDPLGDFAYHLMMYHLPPDIISGFNNADLASLGIPSQQDYVSSYCARTGRNADEVFRHLDFCLAYNMFRLAGILHGIRGRVARGTASSAHAREMGKKVEQVAKIAWSHAERAG